MYHVPKNTLNKINKISLPTVTWQDGRIAGRASHTARYRPKPARLARATRLQF